MESIQKKAKKPKMLTYYCKELSVNKCLTFSTSIVLCFFRLKTHFILCVAVSQSAITYMKYMDTSTDHITPCLCMHVQGKN